MRYQSFPLNVNRLISDHCWIPMRHASFQCDPLSGSLSIESWLLCSPPTTFDIVGYLSTVTRWHFYTLWILSLSCFGTAARRWIKFIKLCYYSKYGQSDFICLINIFLYVCNIAMCTILSRLYRQRLLAAKRNFKYLWSFNTLMSTLRGELTDQQRTVIQSFRAALKCARSLAFRGENFLFLERKDISRSNEPQAV